MFIVIVFLLSLFLCCCWSWWLSPPFSQSKRADRIDVICFTHSGACGAGYLDDRWIETAQYTCSWPPSVTSCKTLCCDVISAFFFLRNNRPFNQYIDISCDLSQPSCLSCTYWITGLLAAVSSEGKSCHWITGRLVAVSTKGKSARPSND